ncbi:leucine-rich repeat domain-containing protein [Coraliomargarita parva]|uniref:leucine-rich repeat domain-containing protein n=1 Tax=Coraliomargarita parva TaxID=3014050 RepID=UPI0022B2EF91|nr:leucine-rich repeat domain-containing protein [Coraliomargarita parva]
MLLRSIACLQRQAAFILPCLALLVNARAETLKYFGNLAFYNRGSYIEIAENTGVDDYGDLVIPISIEGLPVKHIGEAAFKDKTIESLVLPDSVIVIKDDAFYRCQDLASVQLSRNLNEIGDRAFYDCEGLTQLSLPSSLRTIGSAAFRYCQNLSSIPLPEGLESMGDYVLAGTAISDFQVPVKIRVIPAYAYSGCSNLTKLSIPAHVTGIGKEAFSSCKNLRSIDLGSNLERIDEYAFALCSSLSVVVIPERVDHLATGAFHSCDRLAGVIMAGPVPSYVGASLFSRYSGQPNLFYDANQSGFLAYANMPWQAYNSTPIQEWKTANGFTCVVLEDEVYLIAYSGTDSILTIPDSLFDLPVTKIGAFAFFSNKEISSVRIPKSVKLIEPYAFSECGNLTTVFIEGANVMIDERVFYLSSNLTACVFEDDAPVLLGSENFEIRTTLYFYEDARDFTAPRHDNYDSQAIASAGTYNSLFYVNKGSEIEITGCSVEIEELVIPEYIEGLPVRSIARGAFAEHKKLRSIQLPGSIREIGLMAFRYCDSLEAINLPEGIQAIPEEAFVQCLALTDINFPSSLTEIGKRAFYGCLSLSDVEFAEGIQVIGISAFSACPIETMIFPESLERLEGESFSGCALRWVQFLGDVDRIANRVFRNCANLRWVEFDGNLTELEVDAFSYCTSLTAIVYSGAQAPTPLGYSGFLNTPDTITIYHLEGVSGFDHYKYNPCAKVVIEGVGQGDGFFYVNLGVEIMIVASDDSYETVVIPDQFLSFPVTTIGPAAFINTSQLQYIELPDTLTEIEVDAFYNSSLQMIDFGEGVQTIGDRAFSNADKLTYVEFPASVESIGIESFRNCFRLETLVLGENLASIGDGAFNFSSDLDAVIFLGDAPALGVDALGGYPITKYYHSPSASGFDVAPWTSLSLQIFTEYGFLDGLHYIGDVNGLSIVGFSNWWTDGELTIPSQINGIPVTTLGADLFYYKRIETVIIPSSISRIESRAFNTVSGLKNVIFDGVLPDDFSNSGITGTFSFQIYHTNVPEDYVSPFSFYKPKNYSGYESGSDLFYINTGDEIYIVGAGGNTPEIIIPSSIDGLPVTKIIDNAFESNADIVSIQLPDTLVSIGEYAFYSCENLSEIIIPHSVVTIGRHTFERCDSLVRVQLPDGLETLHDATFYLCKSLTEIALPEGLLTIGSHALRGCENLSNIQIPGSVRTISSSAFRDCTRLARIEIPEGVEMLDAETFRGCSALEKVQLPSTLQSIGVRAFYLCTELRHVVIPAPVSEIGDAAFLYCYSLNTIVFKGNAPGQIGSDSFAGAGRYFSFFHLPGATGFSSPTWQGLPAQAIQAYADDQDMLILNDGTEATVRNYAGNDSVFSVPAHFNTVPITQVAPAAFMGRQSLTSLTLPDSVSHVGEYAFAGCTQLQSFALPDGLAVIGEGTFSACSALESITMPTTVTTIGAGAFSGCTQLNINSLHDGIHSIGDYAFEHCNSIVTISLPDSVNTFGLGIFRGSKSLTAFEVPAGLSDVPATMFQDCSALQSIQFHPSVTGIGDYAFANCIALEEISFPDGLTMIGSYAFQGCVGLSSLVFPEGVTTFGNYAFDGCVGLSSIYFQGDAPLNYGSQVFPGYSEAPMVFYDAASTGFTMPTWNGMPVGGASGVLGNLYYRLISDAVEITGLADDAGVVEIPSYINGFPVTSIASQAFYRNSELLSIALPSEIEHIGDSAFYECERLNDLVLPENLKAIGELAFYGCDSLVHVRLPGNLESVGDRAFYDCSTLRSVYVGASDVSFADNTFSYCNNLAAVLFEAEGPLTWGSNSMYQTPANCRIWVLEGTDLSQNLEIFGSVSKVLINGYSDGIFYRISDGTYVPEGDLEIAGFLGHTGWLAIPSEINGLKVSGIADNAFEDSNELQYVFLPEGLLRIGSYAFKDCPKLAFIDVPDTVTEIGSYAFDLCTGLRAASIGRGIDTIGNYAFSSTSKLMEILFRGDAPPNASSSFFEDSRIVKHYYGASGFEGSAWLRYRIKAVSHDQSSWREFYGLSSGLDLWNSQDDSGSPLILRYAFNLDPSGTGEAYSLSPPSNGEDLEIYFYSMAEDVMYIVETSKDLVEWTTDDVILTEDVENGRTIARVPFVGGSNFIRIRIEPIPNN